MSNYDIFISHASEDKETVARPIAEALSVYGVRVWYDQFTLTLGESLSLSIDRGLADSKYGLVILSPAFFEKGWPEYELGGLVAKEIGRDKVILPMWHNISHEDLLKYSPPLANKIALRSDQYSIDEIALRVLQVIRPDLYTKILKRLTAILERNQVDQVIGSVEDRLRKAKTDVWISGNDCKFVVEAESGFIESTLKRNVRINIMCVDPQSAAVDMLTQIDPRFPNKETFINSMISVEQVLRDFRARYPSLFAFRYLPLLPAMGFFITDPKESSGIVKIEIYTAKPWQPISSRPHFVLQREMTDWRQYFISQWENYWELSRIP